MKEGGKRGKRVVERMRRRSGGRKEGRNDEVGDGGKD